MRKTILTIIAVISVSLLGFGGYRLFQYWSESQESNESYSDLELYVHMPSKTPSPEEYIVTDPDSDNSEQIVIPEIDFESLKQINPDIVGWLYCEGTAINYPVVQGSDNTYYLKHLFDGSYNVNGCLFLDCRVEEDFSEPHSIIYGHHMKNGSMFSSLDGYKDQSYYDAHPQMLLITPEQSYLVKLFSGYVASVTDPSWEVDFLSEIEFENWLATSTDQSCFESSVYPSAVNRILTMSTCSYEFDNARFVVLGLLQPIP